jgi:predicted Rossmann fold flavoprotein
VAISASERRRVVVIGAGAAGTMAAIFSAAAGTDTRLLERTADGGRKILISGGGRCNILPARLDESRFVSDSPPHLVRRIVRSWPLREQVAFFERELGLPLVEEIESAKLFPASQRARDVRDRLLQLAQGRGAQLLLNTTVQDISAVDAGWRVELRDGEVLRAGAVIVATGGLSVPSTGSDGTGLRVAQALGHDMTATYPALTPLTAHPAPFGSLSGISLPVTLTARAGELSATATGGFLFTHHGYSGPSVLDVSHVAVRSRLSAEALRAKEGADSVAPARIAVRWTSLNDAQWDEALRPQGSRTVAAAVGTALPSRLADALVESVAIDPKLTLANLSRGDRLRLIDLLVRGSLPWSGDEGYKKAEVTGGGVALSEVDPRTMESRRHKGLYLCGEMLDAFGPIGGYNFLWAWATGRAAGLAASATIKGLA